MRTLATFPWSCDVCTGNNTRVVDVDGFDGVCFDCNNCGIIWYYDNPFTEIGFFMNIPSPWCLLSKEGSMLDGFSRYR